MTIKDIFSPLSRYFLFSRAGMYTFATENGFDEVCLPLKIGNEVCIGIRVFIAGCVTVSDGAYENQ